MWDVFSAGKVPYEPAGGVRKLNTKQKSKLILEFVVNLLKVLVLSLPIYFECIKHLFVEKKKKSVRGWTALVTGGAHGIGREIAKELSKEGCNVAIADIDGTAAQETAAYLKKEFNVKAVGYEVDVANFKLLPKLRDDIEKDIGHVDILVNNASILPLLSLREGDEESIERIVAVNITSYFMTVRIFIKGMLDRRRGHIVNMASMTASYPIPGAIIYTATKYAVTGFTRALEQEIRQENDTENVHFTSVHPYFVATRKDLMESVKLRIPALTPEKTAKTTVHGVLRDERIINIPDYLSRGQFIFHALPFKVQNLFRDHVLKESETRLIKNPEMYVVSKKAN